MYKNIGRKIKRLACFLAWVGIISGCVSAFLLLFKKYEEYGSTKAIIYAVVIIIASILVSWVSSWFIYGFGQLIESTEKISEIAQDFSSGMPKANPTNIQQPLQGEKVKKRTEREYGDNSNVNADFGLPKTRREMMISQLAKLKDDYELGKITYEKYDVEKNLIIQKYSD